MRVDQFDFDLPESAIALRPAKPRDAARMLVVQGANLSDLGISELPGQLRAGDMLVVNRTRVIPARLHGTRARRPKALDQDAPGPSIEVTLHKRMAPDLWAAFARPGKRLANGDTISFAGGLTAQVEEKRDGGEVLFRFSQSGKKLAGAHLDAAIGLVGEMPLPPYIAAKRAVDDQDLVDYQTLFAQEDGSVAAPTAGLHFTPALREKLEAAGISLVEVTLHVGAGTFLPVKVDNTDDHKMHSEWGSITPEVARQLNETRAKGGRIISVGTTALRILETAALDDGTIEAFAGDTDIFITPGYHFKIVDAMVTNFHLPKSTLFMLVSAFAGLENMQAAYSHAIDTGYRFYSYGDACLLWPEKRS